VLLHITTTIIMIMYLLLLTDSSSDDDSLFGGEDQSRGVRLGQQVLPSSSRQQPQPAHRERHGSNSSHGSNVTRPASQSQRSSAIYANVNIPPAERDRDRGGGSPSMQTPVGGGSNLDIVQGSRPQCEYRRSDEHLETMKI
jgi:hypothetical protein